jgi:hypothetical protein
VSTLASMIGRARVVIRQWVRLGLAPTAELENRLAETLVHAAVGRGGGQQLFHRWTPIGAIPLSAAGERNRWEFAFHTSPYHLQLVVEFVLAPQNNGTPTDPTGVLRVFLPTAPSTPVGVASVHYGASDGSFGDTPRNFGGGHRILLDPSDPLAYAELEPDTDYVAAFVDVDYARLVSACVWEITEEPADRPGANNATGGPIFDEQRRRAIAMARALHGRTCVPLWHGGSDTDDSAPSQIGAETGGQLAQSIGSITLGATGTVLVEGELASTLGNVTLQATGERYVFDAIFEHPGGTPTITPTGIEQWFLGAFNLEATATGPTAHSNGEFTARMELTGGVAFRNVTTSDLDGWSETGWTQTSPGVYENTYTKASVTGSYALVVAFEYTGQSGHVFTSTNGAPHTDQDTGPGNAFSWVVSV